MVPGDQSSLVMLSYDPFSADELIFYFHQLRLFCFSMISNTHQAHIRRASDPKNHSSYRCLFFWFETVTVQCGSSAQSGFDSLVPDVWSIYGRDMVDVGMI